MYLAFGIIFIVIEIATLVAYLVLFTKKKMELSKKNNYFFIPVFFLVYFVYVISILYTNSQTSFYDYISLIPKSIKFLAFEVSGDYALPISKVVPLYYGVYIGLLLIVSLAWITAFISLFGKKIKNKIGVHSALKNGCDMVIGISHDSLQYLNNYKNSIVWMEHADKSLKEELRSKGIRFIVKRVSSDMIDQKVKTEACHIIIFKDTKQNLLELIGRFSTSKELKHQLYLHFETSFEEMKFVRDKYRKLNLENNQIFLACFNKHELLAREFMKLYPIAKYIPRQFFNPNLTLKKNKTINVCFVGFGRVNIALFKLMAIEFQFALEKDQDHFGVAPVHYYAFDSDEKKLHNEYFTKLNFDYQNSFENSDLPIMEKVCDLTYETLYAESTELKEKFKKMVNKDSFTYFIISLAHDSENTGYADTLYNALEDYQDHFCIFSRVKDTKIEELNKLSNHIIYFGEDRHFLSHDRIVNEDLMQLAGLVNKQYLSLSSSELYQKWQGDPIIEQYSNIYGALNVFHKCAMMGLELVPKDDPRKALSRTEFEKIYGSIDKDKNDAFYKEHYEFYFEKNIKNTLAFIEHSRWNATYFLFDYKPMKFKDFFYNEQKIRFEHKDTEHKKHACLTTYYDLDKLIQKKYELIKDYKKEDTKIHKNDPDFIAAANIYRYDYMMMDAVYDALEQLPYKVVPKNL